jgi:rhamnosyl/mannosyltransferase
MKVMMVTPYFYPKVGGLENYALNIAKGLKKAGHETFVVTSNHEGRERVEEKVQGLKVIRLPYQFKFSNTPFSFKWKKDLREIIKTEKPDVINAHSPVPGLADTAIKAARRIPTTLTYHAATLRKDGQPVFNSVVKMYGILQRPTFRKATKIIAVSDYVKECLSNNYQSKAEVVYNAIDPTEIPQKKVKRHINRLIFIGSLDKTHSWKGLSQILEAIGLVKKKLPGIELLVLGDGNMRGEYEQQTKNLDIENNVKFKGWVLGDEKYEYIKTSAALVSYPTTENDAFPTVFLEAWGCHTPIVCADIGAPGDIIEDRINGLKLAPRNPEQLSIVICELLQNKSLQEDLVGNGFNRIHQEYNWETQTKRTIKLFERTMLPRVCFINNIIPFYRLPFFEEINKSYDLTVLFCKPITKDRVWTYDLSRYTFRHRILRGLLLGPVIVNPNAFVELWRTKFDLVITNSDPDIAPASLCAFLIAKLRSKRILLWSVVTDTKVHYFPSIVYNASAANRFMQLLVGKLVLVYRKFCFSLGNGFLVLSKGAEQFLKELGVAHSNITFTPQIIPLDLVPEPTKKIIRNGKTFLYIGYLNKRKGVMFLIEAFRSIADIDARLIIAGTGPLASQLKVQAKADKRITFVGYVEGTEKANLYARGDIFVLPTLLDVWGLVINEAIHYGLAILCSNAATAKEIVDARTGKIFQAGDADNLRLAMLNIISDRKNLKQIQRHNFHKKSVSDLEYSSKGFTNAIAKVLE